MPTADDTIVEEETARLYEFCVLCPPNLGQKEESALQKEIEKIIEENGAKQVSKDVWGKRGLAYTIGGHDEGVYVVYHYEIDPQDVKEIDTNLRILPNVLRHLIVKPPKGYQIVKYSETYETWLKERESESERKEREKEAKLQKRVAEKAKRQARRSEEKTKAETTPAESSPADKEKISEELDRIISEDEFEV